MYVQKGCHTCMRHTVGLRTNPRLREVGLTQSALFKLFPELGPFAHPCAQRWKPALTTRTRMTRSILYGIRPFAPRAIAVRILWLLVCTAAFVAPRYYDNSEWAPEDSPAIVATNASHNAALNTTITESMARRILNRHCGEENVPPGLSKEYVDAVLAYALLLSLGLVWVCLMVFVSVVRVARDRALHHVHVASSRAHSRCTAMFSRCLPCLVTRSADRATEMANAQIQAIHAAASRTYAETQNPQSIHPSTPSS